MLFLTPITARSKRAANLAMCHSGIKEKNFFIFLLFYIGILWQKINFRNDRHSHTIVIPAKAGIHIKNISHHTNLPNFGSFLLSASKFRGSKIWRLAIGIIPNRNLE